MTKEKRREKYSLNVKKYMKLICKKINIDNWLNTYKKDDKKWDISKIIRSLHWFWYVEILTEIKIIL